MGDHRGEWKLLRGSSKKFYGRSQMARFTRPRTKHLKLLARDDVRIKRDRPRIAIMSEDEIFSAVTAHFHAFDNRRWISNALQNSVRAITTRELPDGFEAGGWFRERFEIDGVVSAEAFCHIEPVLRTADHHD